MDRVIDKNSSFNIINDLNRFQLLSDNPTLCREAKLQRLLRRLKKHCSTDDKVYQDVLPGAYQAAKFYGLPKLRKHRTGGHFVGADQKLRAYLSFNLYFRVEEQKIQTLAEYFCYLLTSMLINNSIFLPWRQSGLQ